MVNEIDWLAVTVADVAVEHLERGKSIDERAIAKELGVPTLAVQSRLREVGRVARMHEVDESTKRTVQYEQAAAEHVMWQVEVTNRMTGRDYAGALALAEDILVTDPENERVRRFARICREKMEPNTLLIPRVVVSSEMLDIAPHDYVARQIIDVIDGMRTVLRVIESSGLDFLMALSKLRELVLQGIVEIVRVTPEVP